MNNKIIFIITILILNILNISVVNATPEILIDNSYYNSNFGNFFYVGYEPNEVSTYTNPLTKNGQTIDIQDINIINVTGLYIYYKTIGIGDNYLYVNIYGFNTWNLSNGIQDLTLLKSVNFHPTHAATFEGQIVLDSPINSTQYKHLFYTVYSPYGDYSLSVKFLFTYFPTYDYYLEGEMFQNPDNDTLNWDIMDLHKDYNDLSFKLIGYNNISGEPTPNPTPTNQPTNQPTPQPTQEQDENIPTLPDLPLPTDEIDTNFTIPDFNNGSYIECLNDTVNNSCFPVKIEDTTLSDSSFGSVLKTYGYCNTETCTIDDGIDLAYDFSIGFAYISFLFLFAKIYIVRNRD